MSIRIAILCLALVACGTPPPTPLEQYVRQNCAPQKVEVSGFLKRVTWVCPNGQTFTTLE